MAGTRTDPPDLPEPRSPDPSLQEYRTRVSKEVLDQTQGAGRRVGRWTIFYYGGLFGSILLDVCFINTPPVL